MDMVIGSKYHFSPPTFRLTKGLPEPAEKEGTPSQHQKQQGKVSPIHVVALGFELQVTLPKKSVYFP
jgi:hypothetical protein